MDKITYYGMTGATSIDGGGPRLDNSGGPPGETIETVALARNVETLSVDVSKELLHAHIIRAEEILVGLKRLYFVKYGVLSK
jgi:hypothetical protein